MDERVVAQLFERLSSIETSIKYLSDDIKQLDKDINGNGKDGLRTRIEKLEKFDVKIVTAIMVILTIINLFVSYRHIIR